MEIRNFPQNDRRKTLYHLETERRLLEKMIAREEKQAARNIAEWRNRLANLNSRIKERRNELAG